MDRSFQTALLLFLLVLPRVSANTKTLALAVADRDATTTHLIVTGAEVPNVNLQASFDLETWFHLQSAPTVSGTANFAHTNNEPIDSWFFRAVAAPAPAAINVGPLLDTNQVAGAVILPETGGVIEITDRNGVFYQLTIRSNLVTEPTAIRMTIITNFTDMPLSNSFRAAVAFEPDGLEFRGAAELKIRFPNPISEFEMMGYGFGGSGENFHLSPWESSANEVTLAITHFSGIGVAAHPFTPSGGNTYAQGLTFTRDAIREADNWAGDQYRENLRYLSEGKITRQEADQQRRLIKLQRNLRVYLNAIKPLLSAASRDCDIGQVVLKRLDQLEAASGVYGEGIFYDQILRVASAIRCLCARRYLELCEREISGIIATDEMTELLDFVALKTGLIDDPNCDLGSDFDILARLAKGKCHKPWEGTVRFTRVFRAGSTNALAGESSFTHIINEDADLAYFGRIVEFIEQDGGDSEDGPWQSWTMKLAGKFTASRNKEETATQVTPEWTASDIRITKGVQSLPAEGDLMIRFDNGQFSSVSTSAGLGTNQYRMPLQDSSERTVECRVGPNCPPAIPLETASGGNESLYFGESPGITRPGLTAEWQKNGSLKIIYTHNRKEELPAPFVSVEETTETLTVQVWRAGSP